MKLSITVYKQNTIFNYGFLIWMTLSVCSVLLIQITPIICGVITIGGAILLFIVIHLPIEDEEQKFTKEVKKNNETKQSEH